MRIETKTKTFDSAIKIKFEIDTNPPPFATFDTQYRLIPVPYECSLYDINSLFVGKIAAVLSRNWKSRTKGRDLYDYIFYISKSVSFNMKHLEARLKQSGFIKENHILTLDEVKAFLCERFNEINYEVAKQDVLPFIKDISVLNIWSANFFDSITKNIKGE